MSGFVDGEGCFYVSLIDNLTRVSLVFKVTQHIRDADLLKEFIGYFNCGRYSICSKAAGDYIVTKFSDINMKIIPFFNKYPIQGSKSLDFSDFEKVAKLIENKIHLTLEGFEQIRQIKSGMNRERMNKEQSHQQNLISPFPQKRTYVTMASYCYKQKFTLGNIRFYSTSKLDLSLISFNE